MSIIIDPYLIAIPTGEEVTTHQVVEYANRLKEWESIFGDQTQYVISSQAFNEMTKSGLQPNLRNLKNLFCRYDIEHHSAIDFAPTASGVIANQNTLEDEAGFYDPENEFLYEVDRVKDTEIVIPEEIRDRIPPQIAEKFIAALIMAGYSFEVQGDDRVCSLATAPLQSDDEEPNMQIECLLEKIDFETDDLTQEPFTQEWPLLYTPVYLYATYEVIDHLEDPYAATTIAWSKLRMEGYELESIKTIDFTFGPHFNSTILEKQSRTHFTKDVERIFKAIVFVLEDVWAYGSDKHHALGKVPSMHNSPPQVRLRTDKDGNKHRERAARVEITAGANCLHLHYWQCHDESYEFSNITDDHDDPAIYE